MIYEFDTEEKHYATAALLVYAIYRSRDRKRFKVTPDMWAQIERFIKASAKRATNIPLWIEAFKPRMMCSNINPKNMQAGIKGLTAIKNSDGTTEYMQFAESREFLTNVLKEVEHKDVLNALYKETAWIVLLVRDRLEREKPLESMIETKEEE